MAFHPSLSTDATLFDLFRAYPDKAEPLSKLGELLMRGTSPLTVAQRELLAAYVSGLNACGWCYGAHSAVAEIFGFDEKTVSALLEDVDTADVDESMKPLLRYVRKLTETPSKMTPTDAQQVLDAGWDGDALHDAVFVCALFNFMNRYVDGLGITADADYLQVVGQGLAEHGYAGAAPH